MDEYTGKRVAGRFNFSRSGSTSFRDPNQDDRSIKYCSRVGCSSRIDSMKGIRAVDQEKASYTKSPFRSASSSFRSARSKAVAGSSSGSLSYSSEFRKTNQRPENHQFLRETTSGSLSYSSEFRKTRQRPVNHQFLGETGVAESSSRRGGHEDMIEDSDSNSRHEETDDSESSLVASSIQNSLLDSEELELAPFQGNPINTVEPFNICTATSSSRQCKQVNQRVGTVKQDTSASFVRRSSLSRNSNGASKTVSQGMGAGAPRYGIKNLGCTSISDVFPSGCSSSESGHSRRGSLVRKMPCDGGSSSPGVREMGGSSSPGVREMSGPLTGGYSSSLGRGLSGFPSERSFSQPTSRRSRNQPANRDAAVSVRTRRPAGGQTRMRLPDKEGDDILTPPSETVVNPQLFQNQLHIPESAAVSLSRSLPAEPLAVHPNTSGRQGSSGRSARSRSSSRVDNNSTQIFPSPPGDGDGYGRFSMESIAEVLLALERIEQDEELSYEQLLVLETNLFLGGLSFHDQHRDMRMDIDNMSYEELLALEEKMGIVSTALSEEDLAKCLKRSIYAPAATGISCRADDDTKCSICQEEYVDGDVLGKLVCQHRYHLACIDQWLRQKNRCPICKSTVCP